MDEPPGLEEGYYRQWVAEGGKIKTYAPPESKPVWAVLELMGHVRTAGRVTEEERFGGKIGRIDVPTAEGGYVTQYFNASSIYRMTITTEEAARAVAKSNQPNPVYSYEMPKVALPPAPPICEHCGQDKDECDCDPCFDCGSTTGCECRSKD